MCTICTISVCVCVCVCAVAELKAEAARIETEVELESQTRAREAEIQFLKEQSSLEISKARQLGEIEVCSSLLSLLRYTVHRDVRALGLDMFRQFLMMQVRNQYCTPHALTMICIVFNTIYYTYIVVFIL